MKKVFEWIGGFALIAFSFYFTDKVSLLVASKSELMEEIKVVSKDYNEDAIDATINISDNSIIPGKYGRKVNSEESYLNMRDFGSFNENYLIFDYIKPKTSLEDNKDKFITGGNAQNREVSLIIEYDEDIIKYFTSKDIKFNLIAESEEELEIANAEIINGGNENNFKSLNAKIDDNKKICIDSYSNEEMCKKYSYYMIRPKIKLTNTNLAEIKSQVETGSLILISANTKLENIKLLLNEIKYKDLNVVYTSQLIDEKGSR